MRITKILSVILSLVLIVFIAINCDNSEKKPASDVVAIHQGDTITPVDLPVIVPGFHFPEDSNVIYSWLNSNGFPRNYDSANVYKHAWGIWAGLTAESGQIYAGDKLLVYETWLGIDEIKNLDSTGQKDTKSQRIKPGRSNLSRPKQGEHAARFASMKGVKEEGTIDNVDNTGWVTVSYNPPAVNHVLSNNLLYESVLKSYQVPNGIGHIPPFPNSAITLKPFYYVGKKTDSLMRFPVWHGPPPSPMPYPASAWNTYVYIDPRNGQTPGKPLVPVSRNEKNPARLAAATCNLSDFISFKLDARMAKYFNEQQGKDAVAGDIAILAAMHVTSKEISNWTWQSFYWAPNPGNPDAPSSNLASSLRPSQLVGAASHYAVTTAYAEVLPNQPISGGTNTGVTPELGYNPYLEASFGKSVFGFPNSLNPSFQYGVQTNCMSCHALATPTFALGYSTDQYIDMNSSSFINQVQLDFAWSIQGAIIKSK